MPIRRLSTERAALTCLDKGADGGCGLCVIRAYANDKRPRINFIDGINRYLFE